MSSRKRKSPSPLTKTKSPIGLKEAREWLRSLDDAGREGEKAMAAVLTGPQAKQRLGESGVDFDERAETAVVRQMVAHTLDLGILPEKTWTPRSALYAANEMLGAGVTAAEVGKGAAAKDFLRKLIAKGDKIVPRSLAGEFDVAGAGGEFKVQMKKMIQQERARIASTAGGTPGRPGGPLGGKTPAGTPTPGTAPKTGGPTLPPTGAPKIGSFHRQWRDALTDDATEYAMFSAGRGALSLGQGPFHWEDMVNFTCAREWGVGSESGVHFFTAVVQKLAMMPEVIAIDDSGSRDIASGAGMEDLAHEWLGHLYTIGVQQMGSGATFEQVRFSKVALKGLQGGGSAGAKPEHLVCFFAQLVAAAARHQMTLPMKIGNPGRPSANGGEGSSSADNTALSHEEVESITRHHLDESPAGVKIETVRRAVLAQASKPGSSFRGKQLSYYGDFHGGKAAMGEGKAVDGVYVLSPGYRLAMAHVTLASDCAREARVTAGTALEANLQNADVKKRIHELISRRFSDGQWKSSMILPQVTRGRAIGLKALARGFGAFEKCETHDDRDVRGTAESDSVLFRCARGAITWMRVLDTATCDDGFRTELVFWLSELEGLQAIGVPFYLVGCQLGTLLTESDQHRQRSLMFKEDGEDGDCLSFAPTTEMQAAKEALMAMTRRQFQTERIVMARWMQDGSSAQGMHSEGVQYWDEPQPYHQTGKGRGGGKKWKQQRQHPNQWDSWDDQDWGNRQRGWDDKDSQQTPPGKGRYAKKEAATPKGGKGKGKGKGSKGGKGTSTYDLIPKEKWARAHSAERGDDGIALCWFHNNKPGGCVSPATGDGRCSWSHAKRPGDYGDKAWEQLGDEARAKIVTKVQAA
jgi:hypothetical protein